MDYRNLLESHVASGADVTIAAVDHPKEFSSEMGVLEVDQNNSVFAFKEKPRNAHRKSKADETVLVNMGVYVFNIDALRSTVQTAQTPIIDIAVDLIPQLLRSCKVNAYRHKASQDTSPLYWRDVGTVEAYYEANMDLLAPGAPMDPYDPSWPIRSASGPRIWDRSVLSDVGNEVDVNSIIPRAAHIDGALVYRSVLSLGVVLESGAWNPVRKSVTLFFFPAPLSDGVRPFNMPLSTHTLLSKPAIVWATAEEETKAGFMYRRMALLLSPRTTWRHSSLQI
jgi:glucose-1-phosphate adenylyltransferase